MPMRPKAQARGEVHAYVMITVRPKQTGVVALALRKQPAVRRLE